MRAEQSSSTTACTTYRRAGCPRDHPVDSTSLAEHRPEDVPIGHQVDRLLVGGALGLALFRPDGGKLVDESRLVSVVENLALANVGVEPRRVRPHLVFVAEEQDVGEAWRTRKARSASERDARQATGGERQATSASYFIFHTLYPPLFVTSAAARRTRGSNASGRTMRLRSRRHSSYMPCRNIFGVLPSRFG